MSQVTDQRLTAQIQHKRDYIVKFSHVAAAREAAEEQLNALLELQERRQRPDAGDPEALSDARGIIEALLEECRGTSCRLGDRIEDAEQWLRGTFESQRPGDAVTQQTVKKGAILSQQEFDDCVIHGTLQDHRRLHAHNGTQRAVIEQAQKVADAARLYGERIANWDAAELRCALIDAARALSMLLPPKEPK